MYGLHAWIADLARAAGFPDFSAYTAPQASPSEGMEWRVLTLPTATAVQLATVQLYCIVGTRSTAAAAAREAPT